MNFTISKCLLFCCFFTISFITSAQEKKVTCTLRGEIIEHESEALMLFKTTADSRGEKVKIPIENGRFEFRMEDVYIEMYTLAYKEEIDRGGYLPIKFFPHEGEVVFKLHSSEMVRKNTIEGGPDNAESAAYYAANNELFGARSEALSKKTRQLNEEGRYFSKEMKDLSKALKTVKDSEGRTKLYDKLKDLREGRKDLSPEGRKIARERKALHMDYLDWKNKYIKEHPSRFSYYLLFENVRPHEIDNIPIVELRKMYDQLAEVFPDHPYTPLIGKMIKSYAAVKVGEDLIDFTAPDLKGREHQFSSLAKGKVVLLDLWASWCGPCIVKSRTMVPVYETFKDKGFTVIGVAREFDNTDRLVNALEREKFPWLNLVDLHDEREIWLKYNIPYSGGGTFLIDEEGKILEIDPTADSITKLMEERK